MTNQFRRLIPAVMALATAILSAILLLGSLDPNHLRTGSAVMMLLIWSVVFLASQRVQSQSTDAAWIPEPIEVCVACDLAKVFLGNEEAIKNEIADLKRKYGFKLGIRVRDDPMLKDGAAVVLINGMQVGSFIAAESEIRSALLAELDRVLKAYAPTILYFAHLRDQARRSTATVNEQFSPAAP